MVQVYGEGVISKEFECFVMVTIHVTHQEVKYSEIHHIEQPSTTNTW